MADQKGPAPSLITKLAEVMGEMRNVPKEGFNKAQNYKFVRESDVAEKASALLADRHVWVHQTVTKTKMADLYTTASGGTMRLTKVWMDFRFIDGETGETTEPQTFVGYGADTGDKGIYKAMTGAEKYFLMKSFLVSTGDDPEADEKVDKAAAAAGAAASAPRVVRGSTAGVQRGGKSATATKAQVDEIAKLAGGLRLTAETFAPVLTALTGAAPKDGQTVREYLSGLSSDEAGKLIASLMEFKPAEPAEDVHTSSTDVDEEGAPDALTVV